MNRLSANGSILVRPRIGLFVLIAIVVASVALRIGLAVYLGDDFADTRGGTFDQISYDALARRVMDGNGFSFAEDWWPYARAEQPTAFWSFLYTLYLVAVYNAFEASPLVARLIQSGAVGIGIPILSFLLASETFGKRAGLLAAAISGFYLYFVTYAASLMTESFYILAILMTVYVAFLLLKRSDSEITKPVKVNWWPSLLLGFLLGMCMAIALLLRQVVAAYFVLLLVWLLVVSRKSKGFKVMVVSILLACIVVLVLIAPVTIRNYRVFGRLTSLNTNAGFAFFWANHPIYGTRFEPVLDESHGVTYQELIPEELRHLNESALDGALMLRGAEFIIDEPIRFLKLSLSRIPVYFLFWPTTSSSLASNAARVLSFTITLPLMLYGLGLSIYSLLRKRIWRSDPARSQENFEGYTPLDYRQVVILIMFLLVYSAMHIVSWANVRYRLPVDAFLIIFAAFGAHELLLRAKRAGWRILKRY